MRVSERVRVCACVSDVSVVASILREDLARGLSERTGEAGHDKRPYLAPDISPVCAAHAGRICWGSGSRLAEMTMLSPSSKAHPVCVCVTETETETETDRGTETESETETETKSLLPRTVVSSSVRLLVNDA